MSVLLPAQIHVDVNTYVTLDMDADEPYRYHSEVVKRYPPGHQKKKDRDEDEDDDDDDGDRGKHKGKGRGEHAECVKQNETLLPRIYCSTASLLLRGLLIQTASGNDIGLGGPFLNRSGRI